MPTVSVSDARFAVRDFGTALVFGATANDVVSITSSAAQNGLKTISLAAWVFPRSSGGSGLGRIAHKKNTTGGRWLLMAQNNSFQFNAGFATEGQWATSGINFPYKRRYHLVVTMDLSSASNAPIFYVNGSLVATTTLQAANGALTADDTAFYIGNRASARNFDGFIDDFQLYNRILTAAEAFELYRKIISISDGLVGHWKFDEGSGTTAIDSAGGADGTISGPSYVPSFVCKPRIAAV